VSESQGRSEEMWRVKESQKGAEEKFWT